MSNDSLRDEFRSPPATYRGAPFWSWNDRLQIPELTRQVRDMQAHGMGGYLCIPAKGWKPPTWVRNGWSASARRSKPPKRPG